MSAAALLQSILNGLALSGIYILVALGLALVLSIMGIVQVSHGEIYMIGAYIVFYIVAILGGNFFLALILSTLLVGCLGIILERLCFRPFRGQPDRAFTVSIALILILQNVVLSLAGGNPRTYASPFTGVLNIFTIAISWKRLMIVVVGLVLLVALFLFIRITKTGQAMLAISQERGGCPAGNKYRSYFSGRHVLRLWPGGNSRSFDRSLVQYYSDHGQFCIDERNCRDHTGRFGQYFRSSCGRAYSRPH